MTGFASGSICRTEGRRTALDYVGARLSDADRHQVEIGGDAGRICRQVRGPSGAVAARDEHFRNGTPRNSGCFGSDAEFGADARRGPFPVPLASLPVVGRDEYLNVLLRCDQHEGLARKPRKRSTVAFEVEEIRPNCCRTEALASEVARRPGLSTWTLSRKLGEEVRSVVESSTSWRRSANAIRDETSPVSETHGCWAIARSAR